MSFMFSNKHASLAKLTLITCIQFIFDNTEALMLTKINFKGNTYSCPKNVRYTYWNVTVQNNNHVTVQNVEHVTEQNVNHVRVQNINHVTEQNYLHVTEQNGIFVTEQNVDHLTAQNIDK